MSDATAEEWVDGPAGRFWGRHGAAGLLAHNPSRGVLMQLRASWGHHGGTWGLPGGALHQGEPAITGALREAYEEARAPAAAMTVRATWIWDLGYWSYTTVVADVGEPFEPIRDAESDELAWVPIDAVDSLNLHPNFAEAWPQLRARLEHPLLLVVDVANVMGSRPDRWWRDRAGAATRLLDQLSQALVAGFPGTLLGLDSTWRAWPATWAVVEGQARGVKGPLGVTVIDAPADGDATISDVVAHAAPQQVTVVTSDRGLQSRVSALGARTVGAGALLNVMGG